MVRAAACHATACLGLPRACWVAALAGRVRPRTMLDKEVSVVLIAIEGLDGSGKATLAAGVAERLSGALVSFPRYGSSVLADAARSLLADPAALASLGARGVALVFAAERAEASALLHSSAVVVVDRYVASNAAYQAARVPEVERAALRAWVAALEFEDLSLPRPDLTVWVDVPEEVARARRAARAGSGSLAGRLASDAFESDSALLDRAAEQYAALAAESFGGPWLRLDGSLPPEALVAQVCRAVAAL